MLCLYSIAGAFLATIFAIYHFLRHILQIFCFIAILNSLPPNYRTQWSQFISEFSLELFWNWVLIIKLLVWCSWKFRFDLPTIKVIKKRRNPCTVLNVGTKIINPLSISNISEFPMLSDSYAWIFLCLFKNKLELWW